MAKVETRTYKSEKEYRKDLERRLKKGWEASSPQITQTRGGAWKILLPILWVFGPKANRYHVTYTRD